MTKKMKKTTENYVNCVVIYFAVEFQKKKQSQFLSSFRLRCSLQQYDIIIPLFVSIVELSILTSKTNEKRKRQHNHKKDYVFLCIQPV